MDWGSENRDVLTDGWIRSESRSHETREGRPYMIGTSRLTCMYQCRTPYAPMGKFAAGPRVRPYGQLCRLPYRRAGPAASHLRALVALSRAPANGRPAGSRTLLSRGSRGFPLVGSAIRHSPSGGLAAGVPDTTGLHAISPRRGETSCPGHCSGHRHIAAAGMGRQS